MTDIIKYFPTIVLLSLFFTACGSGSNQSGSQNALPTEDLASYSVDASGCLVSDNSEATINYSGAQGKKAKVLMWNCAEYMSTTKKHVELFFTASGACFKFNQGGFITDAICNSRATAPSTPIMSASIVDITKDLYGCYNRQYANTGNVTFFGRDSAIVDPTSSSVGFQFGGSIEISLAGEVFTHGSFCSIGPPASTMLRLYLWDGTLLDSLTKTL